MTDAAASMQQHLDAVWAKSLPDIEGRVEAIESAAIALLEGSLTSEVRQLAEREAHKLAGVSGTFGFPAATDLAREAEGLLAADHDISPADLVRLSAIAIELRRELIEVGRSPGGPGAPRDRSKKAATRVVMVDDDQSMLALVTALLGDHDIGVFGTSDPDALRAALVTHPPDLLILDVDMPVISGIELCKEIRADGRWDALPIVFLTSRTAIAVDLFDAGADNYLMKPVNADELLSVVKSRVRRIRRVGAESPGSAFPSSSRTVRAGDGHAPDVDVVVVDDDAVLADLLTHSLEARGHSVCTLSDGSAALENLAGANPRLRAKVIVLDVGLPEHDGLTVLRALSRDGVTAATRVIMLTARSLESEVLQALDLGAFDHVAKPFSVPVLMHRIRRALGERGTSV